MSISTPTTFVIGAGASECFGAPLAGELASRAKKLEPKDDLTQLLYHFYGIDAVNTWLGDFRSNQVVKSIDKFLQDRSHLQTYNEIGRSVMVGTLALALQRTAMSPEGREDWVDEIVAAMADGTSSLGEFERKNTGAQVVSFNFENFAQWRVVQNLEMRFRRSDRQDYEEVASRTFPVHHVHGLLPPLPVGAPWDDMRGGAASWLEWMPKAAKAIRSVHDTEVDQAVLNKARAAVRDAHVVVWLGLHYHSENLDRLAVRGPVKGATRSGTSQRVIGSAFGLKAGRRDWVKERIAGISLAADDAKCLHVLENYNWRL